MKNHSDKANKRDSVLQNLILPVHPLTPFPLRPLPITLVVRCRYMGLPQQIRAVYFLASVWCSFECRNRWGSVGCEVEDRMRRVEGDGVCVEVVNLQWRWESGHGSHYLASLIYVHQTIFSEAFSTFLSCGCLSYGEGDLGEKDWKTFISLSTFAVAGAWRQSLVDMRQPMKGPSGDRWWLTTSFWAWLDKWPKNSTRIKLDLFY